PAPPAHRPGIPEKENYAAGSALVSGVPVLALTRHLQPARRLLAGSDRKPASLLRSSRRDPWSSHAYWPRPQSACAVAQSVPELPSSEALSRWHETVQHLQHCG